MKVELVSLTSSVINGKALTAEDLIVYIARVSNPSNQDNLETAPRLINYMIKNKHWSPFEMADMTVKIVTSRAIAQQILRHRSFSFQEFSQRYSEVVNLEPIGFRLKADKNRQSSSEIINLEEIKLSSSTQDDIGVFGDNMKEIVAEYLNSSRKIYNLLLEKGVAKECARMLLPLTTQTVLYMKGSIRSWIHYLQVRDDEHAQLEHQLIAKEIKAIFLKSFPYISEALEWNVQAA